MLFITSLSLPLFTEVFSFASVTPLLQSARSDHVVVSLFFLSFLPASYLAIVTPLLNVRLDDVLDRKHLPPLGTCYVLKRYTYIYFPNYRPEGF